MVKKTSRSHSATVTKRRRNTPVPDPDEWLYRKAIIYLIRNEGGLFVPTAHREIRIKGLRVWIFTVTLRYPTGHEGYVGDLLFDGEKFTMLTEPSVIDERVAQIAADPERLRKWNEYRASTLQTGTR